jgi:hypothetical protein
MEPIQDTSYNLQALGVGYRFSLMLIILERERE